MNQHLNNQQDHSRQLQAEGLLAHTIANAPLNDKYSGEIKRFKTWVQNQPMPAELLHVTIPGKYITRASIETYYLQIEKERRVQRNTLMKTVYALNRLAAVENSPEMQLDDESFDIKRGSTGKVVMNVIDFVTARYNLEMQSKEINVHAVENDPYAIINQEELSKVMLTQLKGTANHSPDAITAWGITTVTLMRFDSARILTVDKLKVVLDLPPHGIFTPFDGMENWTSTADPDTDKRLLGIIIPPVDQKKKNNQMRKTEGVGAYRHKRFERCAIGLTAFAFFIKCSRLGIRISFLKRADVPNNQIHWKDVKLFDLTYDTAHNTYQAMLERAGVGKWKKVTHMISICYDLYVLYYKIFPCSSCSYYSLLFN